MLESFGLSDIGRRRTSNEDAWIASPEEGLFAVADGMGGHAAGEVASRLALDTFREEFTRAMPPDRSREDWLTRAVRAANHRILEEVDQHRELHGMGTTFVTAHLAGAELLVGHVGDSRAYLLRDTALRLLTEDHSWVNEQVRLGILPRGEAARHPARNVITRALGGREDVEVDLVREVLLPGDLLILCSDGLNTMLEDDEIRRLALQGGGCPEAIARALVQAANGRGGNDNITVVAIRFDGSPRSAEATLPGPPRD